MGPPIFDDTDFGDELRFFHDNDFGQDVDDDYDFGLNNNHINNPIDHDNVYDSVMMKEWFFRTFI